MMQPYLWGELLDAAWGKTGTLVKKSDENLCLNRWHQSQYCFPIVKLIVGFRQLESTIQFVDIVTGVTKIATLT